MNFLIAAHVVKEFLNVLEHGRLFMGLLQPQAVAELPVEFECRDGRETYVDEFRDIRI